MPLIIGFPDIDPIIFQIGPFALRWYALAYVGGILISWWYMRRLALHSAKGVTLENIDDFIVWATLGIVFGGRLGYVLFYRPEYYLSNPEAILQVWQGGMSFHGGLIGVLVAGYIFVRRKGLSPLAFADIGFAAAPIGIFLGRVANFVNGELYGRVSDVPWAMVFPRGGPGARHPSQLYEAALEGLLLFSILYFIAHNDKLRQRTGLISGVFLIGYWLARSISELFRQPDAHIGFMSGGTTMGQWLSVPMVLLGVYLIYQSWQSPKQES